MHTKKGWDSGEQFTIPDLNLGNQKGQGVSPAREGVEAKVAREPMLELGSLS